MSSSLQHSNIPPSNMHDRRTPAVSVRVKTALMRVIENLERMRNDISIDFVVV